MMSSVVRNLYWEIWSIFIKVILTENCGTVSLRINRISRIVQFWNTMYNRAFAGNKIMYSDKPYLIIVDA